MKRARGTEREEGPRPVTEGRGTPPLERVRKRDGRLVPFQAQKIADAVGKAMDAAGEGDPLLAREVAGIVELSLRESAAGEQGAAPHIEAIQDLVERVLMELGKSAVAKAYILHRDRRAQVRATLRVHRSESLRAPVRVREREGVSDWSKGRIVAALMAESELPRESAEDVAAAVEARVFASGTRSVTTGLVRELVASELFERGLAGALASARVVGVPRGDVRRALEGQPLEPWRRARPGTARGRAFRPRSGERAARELCGDLLTRYALESVLPEAIGELHRAGDLHVVGLETLGRPLTLAVEAELLAGGGDPTRSAQTVLDALAGLSGGVARGLVLERPAALLAPLARTTREKSPHGLTAWLRALQAVALAGRVQVDLGTPGGRYPSFTARLVEELSELGALPFGPRLFLDGPELEALLEEHPDQRATVAGLLATGRIVPTWSGPEEEFAGPGCHRRRGERGLLACQGAIALNLPRIARRAGAFREELLQSALAELVQAAVETARALDEIQGEPGDVFARGAYAVVPVGLREALWTLGDGTVDPAVARRVLGFLGEAARRFAPDGRLVPAPVPFFGREAAARFAYLDARQARVAGGRQAWLFEGAGVEPGEGRDYSRGFRIAPVPGLAWGRAEAEALETVPTGALELGPDAPPASAAPASDAERALDAWRRFEVVRRARTGELVLELFPRPRPLPKGDGEHRSLATTPPSSGPVPPSS
jgi:hypothetical protein